MWLPLIGLALAGTEVGTRVDVYDDGEVRAWMPAAAVDWSDEKAEVGAGYAVDVVSGATRAMVDTVSSATRFDDVRHASDLAITATPTPELSGGLSVGLSAESDYVSQRAGLHGGVELFERMSVLEVGWTLTMDDAGRQGDTLDAREWSNDLDLSWDQILGRNTRGAVLLSGGHSRCSDRLGCLASPYRYVGVLVDEQLVAIAERGPASQSRAAGALRLAQALGSRSALKGGYRLYADTWGIVGHTGDGSVAHTFADDRGLIQADGRLAHQSAASFYRDRYVARDGWNGLPAYRTADRELAEIWSVSVGGRLEWTFAGVDRLETLVPGIRVRRLWWRYPDFSGFERRAAWVVGGGVDATL